LNKHSQNQVFHAARLVLLVGGSVAAASFLPSPALPDSRGASGAPGTALRATARVNFKIIIPQVLSLRVGDVSASALGAGTVAVMSNGHNATLNASLRTLDATTPARGNLILNGAARKGIAQDAQCSLAGAPATADSSGAGNSGAGNGGTRQVICTVSMP
jgi:hypothetical protein